MLDWYPQYESQCWYPNTFLINKKYGPQGGLVISPRDIAKNTDEEWNNVTDSGCHFTCIAMMLGLNPGYWAGLLSNQGFFQPDESHCAIDLAGTFGDFTWDMNAPYGDTPVRVDRFWHPQRRERVTLELTCVTAEETAGSAREAARIIRAARKDGLHIICGYTDHSRLVAGQHSDSYYLWDPDLSDSGLLPDRFGDATDVTREDIERANLEANITGQFTLKWLYELPYYRQGSQFKDQSVEFWLYRAAWTAA